MTWLFHAGWQPANLLFLQIHYYALLVYDGHCGLKMLLKFYIDLPGLC